MISKIVSENDQEELSNGESIDDDNSVELVKFLQIPDNVLPAHFRCASHTLCLVSSRDAVENKNEVKYGETYRIRHESAFSKLNSLCRKANKPKSSEIIYDSLKCALKVPCKTRWNSLFDCIKHLLKFEIDDLNIVMEKLELVPFLSKDIEFLKEYLAVMYPIATGIDDLQANSYYGFFMPTLHNIKYELASLAASELKHCAPLLKEISDGFFRRFQRFFNFDRKRRNINLLKTEIRISRTWIECYELKF